MINIIEIPKKITHIDVLIKDKHIIEVPLPGLQGKSGKSSYEIAVDNGFVGTEKEWLSSLKGDPFTYEDFTYEQLAELTGPKGATGYTYIPKVDTNGNISWTNNGNLVNPTTVNIKGPKGNKGDTGTAATISIGTVSTGEAGTSVSITNSGSTNAAILDFVIPKGDKGDPFRITKVYESIGNMNSDYSNPDIPIGSFVIIETGDVNNSDNSKLFIKTDSGYSFITDLSGSQGIVGPQGLKGDKGEIGYYFTPNVNSDGLLSWVNNGNLLNPDPVNIKGPQGIQGPIGPKGDIGLSATIKIGTVNTIDPDSNAEVTNSGTTNNAVFNFKIPKGDKGLQGERGFYFTPNIDMDGNISWTNNGDLNNPNTINIKGPKGDKGDKGNKGESAIISKVNATIDNNIGIPSVTVDLGGTELNRTFTFNFKNIKGEQGIQGIQGEIGPQGLTGNKGDKGDTGEQGPQGISVTNAEINFNNGHLILTLE